jgi:alpha-D-xyloside xylohydrolase
VSLGLASAEKARQNGPAARLDPLAPDWSALAPVEGHLPVQVTDHAIRGRTDAGPFLLEDYAPGIVRLRLGEPTAADHAMLAAGPAPYGAGFEVLDRSLVMTAGEILLRIDLAPFRLTLEVAGQELLASGSDGHFIRRHRLPPFARTAAGWFAAMALDSGEPVYGLGEKWGPLDRRGQVLTSWVEDALGVNGEKSYKNCPFAWSPKGWGLFVHTPCRVTHGIGHAAWSQRSYGLEVEDETLDLFIVYGATPEAILERFSWLVGRPPPPPRWSLGPWYSKAFYRDRAELLDTAAEIRRRDLPGAVITLDGRAWQDTRTRFAFDFDQTRYPDPKAVIDRLHDQGFRVCCWEYPLVSVHGPLFAELEAKGYLLKDPASGRAFVHEWDQEPFSEVLTPLPPSGLIDFTHPGAYADWRDRHEALFGLGVDLIKCDFGEQVPAGCIAHDGSSGERLHNVYPLLYNRCVAEATLRFAGHGFVFSRAGWSGSQRYPGHWGGDPQSDWEGLAASIRGGLSWSLTGGACYASDIGGFYGEQPDAELFVRWTQAAVFASHLRFHGIGPREPWAFGEAAEAIVRQWLELRCRLIPYIERSLDTAALSGLPLMRAMPLAFPDQPEAWRFDTQYLFGDDLLVCPILKAGGEVLAYFPEGCWRHLLTGEPLEGGRSRRLKLPLKSFPAYVKEGAGPVFSD